MSLRPLNILAFPSNRDIGKSLSFDGKYLDNISTVQKIKITIVFKNFIHCKLQFCLPYVHLSYNLEIKIISC